MTRTDRLTVIQIALNNALENIARPLIQHL
jgi:hypothetical protein